MPKTTIFVFVGTTLLTLLAGAGWVVFISGFGALNTEDKFFEQLNKLSTLPPDQAAKAREMLFLPYNSYYIVASLSPLLFILMIVQSALTMLCKAENIFRILVSIFSIPIYILVGFVLISSGVVFQTYTYEFVFVRLDVITPPVPPLSNIINTIFAGILIETIFLILALMTMHAGSVVGAMQQKGNHQGYVEHKDT